MARILENLVRDKWVDTRPGMIWPGTSMAQYDRIWVQADLKHESCTQNAEARPVWSVSSWSFTSRDSTAQHLLMVCIKSSREPYLTSLHTPHSHWTASRCAHPTVAAQRHCRCQIYPIRCTLPAATLAPDGTTPPRSATPTASATLHRTRQYDELFSVLN
jgi:hypothetical protein